MLNCIRMIQSFFLWTHRLIQCALTYHLFFICFVSNPIGSQDPALAFVGKLPNGRRQTSTQLHLHTQPKWPAKYTSFDCLYLICVNFLLFSNDLNLRQFDLTSFISDWHFLFNIMFDSRLVIKPVKYLKFFSNSNDVSFIETKRVI